MSEEKWESIELNKLKNTWPWNWFLVTRTESFYYSSHKSTKEQGYLCSGIQEHFLFWERIVNQKNPHICLLHNVPHPTQYGRHLRGKVSADCWKRVESFYLFTAIKFSELGSSKAAGWGSLRSTKLFTFHPCPLLTLSRAFSLCIIHFCRINNISDQRKTMNSLFPRNSTFPILVHSYIHQLF